MWPPEYPYRVRVPSDVEELLGDGGNKIEEEDEEHN